MTDIVVKLSVEEEMVFKNEIERLIKSGFDENLSTKQLCVIIEDIMGIQILDTFNDRL